LISPRIGMPVFGLGLLEAIPENTILAHTDPDDLDKDDISGKANQVWDPISGTVKLGRFSWNAGTPSVLVQTAGAYNEDMGLTKYLKPKESSFGQSKTDPNSVSPEVSNETVRGAVKTCFVLWKIATGETSAYIRKMDSTLTK
jgi:CxxC motif-containing protein (DUF1111 family)